MEGVPSPWPMFPNRNLTWQRTLQLSLLLGNTLTWEIHLFPLAVRAPFNVTGGSIIWPLIYEKHFLTVLCQNHSSDSSAVQFPKTNFVSPVRIYFVYLHGKTSEKNTQGVNKGRKSAVSIICWLFPLCFDSRVSALRQIFRRQFIDKKWQGFQQQMDERIMGKERAFLYIQICFS